MIPPIMSVAARIADLEDEVRYLRNMIENSGDADVKNGASKLIGTLNERIRELRKIA